MAYYVSPSDCTCAEPVSGWFYTREDEDGNEEIVGPFATKTAALDDESGGAYSDYLYQQHRDRDLDYRDSMRDAGRGHLLGEDD